MELRDLILLKLIKGGGSSLVEETATGNPVGFDTEVAKSLKSLVVPLTYSQEGTGDPSPTNIRPISGVSGLFCVHAKKNMATLRGYSAANVKYDQEGTLSNNYGTTISTTSPESSVTITQSDSTTDYAKSNYRNGYFCIRTDNMVEGQHYDVSFKRTNITSNPLDASSSDWMIMPGQGSGSTPSEVKGDVYIWKNILYREAVQYRQGWEVRNCGMSCTVSEFMITPANTNDGVFEAYDGAKLDVTFPAFGKNLLKVTATSKTEAGVTYTVNPNGTITVSGTASGYSGLTLGSVDVSSVQKVTISGLSGNTTNVVWDSFNLYDADDTLIQNISGGGSASNKTIDLSQYPTAVRMTVAIKRAINVATSGTAKPMVEIGETSSAFEPYCDTVYGGSLDLVSGVLTLTHQMLSTTWGAGTNSKVLTTNERRRFEFPVSCIDAGSGTAGACNMAKWTWDYDIDTVHFYNHQMYSYVFLPTETSDSTELQIVGKLATPITVQLTPAQASAFVGDNTVWTNTTGDLTVKYYDKQ